MRPRDDSVPADEATDGEVQDTPARESLREATLSGVGWVARGRAVAEVANFVASVVLARLLATEDFGVAAIAYGVYAVAASLTGVGLSSALVQRDTVTRAHLEVSGLLGLLSGVFLGLLTWAAAPLLEPILGARVVSGIELVSPIFLILGISATPSAILQRRLDFRRLTTAEIASTLMGVIASVALASAGVGVEALIIGVLVRAGVYAALILNAARPPMPRWRRREAIQLGRFGVPTAVSSVGYVGARNVDYVIVAAQLGLAQTGIYWRAYQLAFEYQAKVTLVMQSLALPVLSRSRDLEDMRRIRYRIVRVHAVTIFPLLACFIVVAPVLIPWLYGEQWKPAVLPSQLLAMAAFTSPVLAGVGAFTLALGRPQRLMIVNWASAIGYAAVLAVSARHGLTAVCLSVIGYHAVNLFTSHHFLLAVPAAISGTDMWREVRPASVGAVVTLIAGWLAREATVWAQLPALLVLTVSASVALSIYFVLMRRVFPGAYADLQLIVDRVAIRRRPEAAI